MNALRAAPDFKRPPPRRLHTGPYRGMVAQLNLGKDDRRRIFLQQMDFIFVHDATFPDRCHVPAYRSPCP
jgi:hypothetical protein